MKCLHEEFDATVDVGRILSKEDVEPPIRFMADIRIVVDGRYPGGKGLAGVWQWILGKMPPHSVYAEPFAGHAAIARRKWPALQTYLVDTDPLVIEWLRSLQSVASVIRGDGIRWLTDASARGLLDYDALVYVDPPYMLGTRTKRRLYQQELTDAQHAQLLEVLLELPCRVMVSGYWSELYAKALANWHADVRSVITRGGVMRDEWLWTNFAPDATPSSLAVKYSELGSDYRERERVSRRVQRWQRNFLVMSARERHAVLRALLDVSTTARSGARATSGTSMMATTTVGGGRPQKKRRRKSSK